MSASTDVIQIIDDKLERALPVFMGKMEKATNEAVKTAVDKFYSDYEPQTASEYDRANDLADIVKVGVINGGLNGTAIRLDMGGMEKPSWHYERSDDGIFRRVEGYPEDIYESVFKQGYHGGRGGSHSLWKKRTAEKTEAPFDIMIKEIEKYANGQAQADFTAAYDSV